MVKCFGLGFGGWRSGEGSLDLCRGGSVREKLYFIGDGATKVVERFANVGRVVISLVRILGT